MLEEINYKVLSYCEIPEEILKNSWLVEYPTDVYVKYSLGRSAENELDGWIMDTYPELISSIFFIHIDY